MVRPVPCTIFDYLEWRGDLTFAADPCNSVDQLILATFAYVHFTDIVPAAFDESIGLADAAQAVIDACSHDDKALARLLRDGRDLKLLEALRDSPRFSEARLSGYIDIIDDELDKQFCAMCIELPDGACHIAFRGTDSTIAGWKEDFNMGFETEVPAQASAARYLEDASCAFPGPLWVCGHSKGGNLAIYAAVKALPRVQDRIASVFNGDGPGFLTDMLESDAYHAVRDRIDTFIPESSVVGMLMEHEDDYAIVKSSNMGLLQHEPYSWELKGTRFDTVASTDIHSRLVDMTLKEWCTHIGTDDRRKFISGVYQLISNTDAQTLSDLFTGKNTFEILKAVPSLDWETRNLMLQAFGVLGISARDSMAEMARGYIEGNGIHLPALPRTEDANPENPAAALSALKEQAAGAFKALGEKVIDEATAIDEEIE